MINLVYIPLNPLSVSELWPASHLGGQSRPEIRFFWRWPYSIGRSDGGFKCGISDGDIQACNVLNSEVRA